MTGFSAHLERRLGARWIVPSLFVLAIGLRLAVVLAFPQTPSSDGEWYLVRAAEMARGLGYQEAGHPTAFWPVGYPALLAVSLWLCGPSLAVPIALNLIAAAAILALVLRCARLVGAGEAGARLAGLLYAIYPAHIVYTGVATSEATSTAVTMAAFVLLVGGRRRSIALVAAGLLFGVATLMRAQMLMFPAGLLIAMMIAWRDWRWRDAAKAAVIVHLAMAVVVLPWTVRNYHALGAVVPVSTNGGVSLYYGANPHATGGWYAWERTPEWDRVVGIPYGDRVARQVELDRRFKAAAKAWIVAHPAAWLALGPTKVALLWAKDGDAFWGLDGSYPDAGRLLTLVRVADQLFYMAILALALAAVALALRARWRGRDAPMLLMGAMPAFATLTAFGFTGQTRYHYPAMPFAIVAAGWMLAMLVRRGSQAPDPHHIVDGGAGQTA